jgi:hypothetical protein
LKRFIQQYAMVADRLSIVRYQFVKRFKSFFGEADSAILSKGG